LEAGSMQGILAKLNWWK